jgi:hypothetical protein
MVAFEALLGQIYTQTYLGTQAVRSEVDLAALVASIEAGQKDPGQIICQTPAWVDGRLWESRSVESDGDLANLRRWVDQWGLLQHPALVPGDVWGHGAAESFRTAAVSVIASEAGLGGWPETRETYAQRAALANNVPVADVEPRFPQPHAALVDRGSGWTTR